MYMLELKIKKNIVKITISCILAILCFFTTTVLLAQAFASEDDFYAQYQRKLMVLELQEVAQLITELKPLIEHPEAAKELIRETSSTKKNADIKIKILDILVKQAEKQKRLENLNKNKNIKSNVTSKPTISQAPKTTFSKKSKSKNNNALNIDLKFATIYPDDTFRIVVRITNKTSSRAYKFEKLNQTIQFNNENFKLVGVSKIGDKAIVKILYKGKIIQIQ